MLTLVDNYGTYYSVCGVVLNMSDVCSERRTGSYALTGCHSIDVCVIYGVVGGGCLNVSLT